jgi:hypothetical protein
VFDFSRRAKSPMTIRACRMKSNTTKRPAVPQFSVRFNLSKTGIFSRNIQFCFGLDLTVTTEPKVLWSTCARCMRSGVHFNLDFLNS